MSNKKKYSLISLIVVVLLGGAFFTYDALALEKEKSEAEEVYIKGKEDSLSAQREIDEKIIKEWENKIYPGVTIFDKDFSGYMKEEALVKLNKEVKPIIEENSVTLTAKDQDFKLDYKDLELKLEAEKKVNEALKVGKDLGFDEKIKRIETSDGENLDIDYDINEEKLDSFIKEIEEKINITARNASIKISGGNYNVTKEQNGSILNSEKAKKEIKEVIFNKDKTNEKIEGEMVASEPAIKADDLSKINGVLTSYKTSYGNSSSARINNIGVAANKISESLIMPGEVFSYNQTLGNISVGNGFQNAGVIKGDKIEDGIGGGICQVSSTLYQAALNSGVGIKQRRNHSMKVFYLDAGLDAVVYSPSLDLKLVNNYSSPIVIKSYSGNGIVNVTIHGNKADLGGKSYRVYSKVNQVKRPTTTRRPNPNMLEGKEEVILKPVTGYVSTTYRDIIKGGKVIKTEILSKDSYKRVNGIVEYGTKKAPVAPPEPETPEEPVAPEAPEELNNPPVEP